MREVLIVNERFHGKLKPAVTRSVAFRRVETIDISLHLSDNVNVGQYMVNNAYMEYISKHGIATSPLFSCREGKATQSAFVAAWVLHSTATVQSTSPTKHLA